MKAYNVLVDEWMEAKRELNHFKELELKLRNSICPKILQDIESGSKTTLFGGVKVRATAKINYTIDDAELAILGESLTPEEESCIKWVPKLVEKNYRQLPDDSKLRNAVTAKPGQSQLTVI